MFPWMLKILHRTINASKKNVIFREIKNIIII